MTSSEKDWIELEKEVSECRLCELARTRNKTVFGEGSRHADLLFIGEGPGRQEDLEGRPFVGPSGKLLTRIIEAGMKLSRAQVFITNLVKCRPTVNLEGNKDRPPNEQELKACAPYLLTQIRGIAPRVIVTVGGPATKFLLKSKQGITKLRGTWHDFQGIPVMPIYHPSYVLRNGGEKSPLKRDVWHDIRLVMDKLAHL